jgi:hypothetical protein
MIKKSFTIEEAQSLGNKLGINWDDVEFNPVDLQMGMNVELEHGSHDEETNITNDDPEMTAKIAWAHLKEFPDYYLRLNKMEDAVLDKSDYSLRDAMM